MSPGPEPFSASEEELQKVPGEESNHQHPWILFSFIHSTATSTCVGQAQDGAEGRVPVQTDVLPPVPPCQGPADVPQRSPPCPVPGPSNRQIWREVSRPPPPAEHPLISCFSDQTGPQQGTERGFQGLCSPFTPLPSLLCVSFLKMLFSGGKLLMKGANEAGRGCV